QILTDFDYGFIERKFFTTDEAIDVTGRPINENGVLKIRTRALNAAAKLSFSTATATAVFSLAKGGSSGGIFLRRALIAAAFSSENGGCCGFLSVSERYNTLYLSLTPPPSPSHNPFSSLLLPLPPFVAALPLSRHHPPPPFSSHLHLSPVHRSPRPIFPDPSPSFTSSQSPPSVNPDSHLHHPPTPPLPTVPSPFSYSGHNSTLSIILLRPRQPPSPSSTPLFPLSIHLPLPFPTP
ncbi:unnamed protein product, partial [Musa acuminata var. zebrina]